MNESQQQVLQSCEQQLPCASCVERALPPSIRQSLTTIMGREWCEEFFIAVATQCLELSRTGSPDIDYVASCVSLVSWLTLSNISIADVMTLPSTTSTEPLTRSGSSETSEPGSHERHSSDQRPQPALC